MIRNFKNMILALSAVGLVVGMHAADDHTPKAASAGKTALASAAIVAGTMGGALGLMNIAGQVAATQLGNGLPPSLATQLLNTTPYVLLTVPAVIVALGSGIYLFKSAKGAFAKFRSFLGSTSLMAGGLLLAMAFATYIGGSTIQSAANLSSGVITGIKDAAWYSAQNISQKDVNDAAAALLLASGITAVGGTAFSLTGYAIQPGDK